MRARLLLTRLRLGLALIAAAWSALPAHLTSVPGGTRGPGRIGTGTGSMEVNDSLTASLDLFGYLADSRASAWRRGDPLGPGGKPSLTYNRYLYRELPFDRPYLLREELRPLYQDFAYLPLWQPTQLAARARYRFLPGVWGTLGLEHNGDVVQISARDITRIIEVGELNLRWAPEAAPGLALVLGQLRLSGTYCPLFDQFPLENFYVAGLQAAYSRDLKAAGSFRVEATAGKEALGRTLRTDPAMFRETEMNVYLDAVRERHHLLASARWTSPRGLSLGLLAGAQVVPADSTVRVIPNSDLYDAHRWRETMGWQAGAEAGYRGFDWEHRLALSHGRGDVQMAWSGPDPVYDPTLDSTMLRFTRSGSALTQAVYWMGFRSGRLRLEGGAWWQARAPSKRQAAFLRADGSADTLRLGSRDFRAAKLSLQPALAAGPLLIGLRYDGFFYLDPAAHANTLEMLTDQALRPVTDSLGVRLEGPSPWEREAVDAHILSPFVELDLGAGLHVRATGSGAWYRKTVWRQGGYGRFHGNAVLAAWMAFRFVQLDGL